MTGEPNATKLSIALTPPGPLVTYATPAVIPTRDLTAIRIRRRDIAEVLRAYDNAKTGRERGRALAQVAGLRAEHRQADRASDAQAIIDALARKWTAWLRESEQ